ncbi:hypothetical protein FB474_0121 [Oryzihumus leptocrescens]|uniref:Uncharacterized protein n=2 Tax=Oryzihumus leptocrescens TaxID=297536 RepID=A0A542ZEL4_9MICO|nr:hypothetical protein FB474_0121 [Oryzihumus leptocrescens]
MAGAQRPVWKSVALWMLVALLGLVSIAGLLSVGLFIWPFFVAGVVLMAIRPGWARGVATLLFALAASSLIVVWFNRRGPGRVCTVDPQYGLGCADYLNPWLFAGVAAAAAAVAVVLFVRAAKGGSVSVSGAGPGPS